jgi:hypothetical protein
MADHNEDDEHHIYVLQEALSRIEMRALLTLDVLPPDAKEVGIPEIQLSFHVNEKGIVQGSEWGVLIQSSSTALEEIERKVAELNDHLARLGVEHGDPFLLEAWSATHPITHIELEASTIDDAGEASPTALKREHFMRLVEGLEAADLTDADFTAQVQHRLSMHEGVCRLSEISLESYWLDAASSDHLDGGEKGGDMIRRAMAARDIALNGIQADTIDFAALRMERPPTIKPHDLFAHGSKAETLINELYDKAIDAVQSNMGKLGAREHTTNRLDSYFSKNAGPEGKGMG